MVTGRPPGSSYHQGRHEGSTWLHWTTARCPVTRDHAFTGAVTEAHPTAGPHTHVTPTHTHTHTHTPHTTAC